jgi:hypothetical protein
MPGRPKPRWTPKGLSARLLTRLRESAVPVRTSVLVAQCAARVLSPRGRVWEALLRLERLGVVVRRTVRPEVVPCCPACGRALAGAHRETFWEAVPGCRRQEAG